MKVFEFSIGKAADNLADRLDFIVSPLGDLIARVKDAIARLMLSFSQMGKKEPVVNFTRLSDDDMGHIFESDVFVLNSDGKEVPWDWS